MKQFKSYLSEQNKREFITKSWYHPDTDREIMVDYKPTESDTWGGLDSHSNHAYLNHKDYGFESPEHIFTSAGHSPEVAKELTGRIKKHHDEMGGYVDWHDPLVHAMHKNGWVRVVKGNDWESDLPHLHVGSHNHELNRRAAKKLQADGQTKKVELAAYTEKGLNDKDPYSPPSKMSFEDYEL